MKTQIIIEAERTGYTTEQVHRTMTVGELIEYLQQFDEDAEIYLSHDEGYTFGGITYDKIEERVFDEEESEEYI